MKTKNLNSKIKSTQKRGFSLVELLVVITIIAILSVVAYTAVGGQTAKARDSKRKEDLGAIQSALEIYAIENSNKYPASLNDLTAKQMPKGVPTDPGAAGKPYKYKVNTSGTKYEVAATLENDGEYVNYEAYVIGNASSILTTDGDGKYHRVNDDTLQPCSGKTISSGKVNNGDANFTAGPPVRSCVPYDPNN